MLSKRSNRMFLVGILVLLTIFAVWARGNAPIQARTLSALQDEAVRVSVVTGAIREGATVTYSITLLNGSATDVTDIFIAGAVPLRASFAGATAMPPKTGFRGVEDGNAVFLAERLPALGSLGPFKYQVTVGAERPGLAWAWVHWRAPNEGTTVSNTIAAPGGGVFPRIESASLAIGEFPRLPEGDWAIAILETHLPPGTVFDTGEVPPFLFYQTEGWMSTELRDGTRKSTGPGSSYFETRPHVHTVVGDAAVKGLVWALVPAGAEVPLRSGVNQLWISPKLEGLRHDVPYLWVLQDVKFHTGGEVGTKHVHSGPNIRYTLEGNIADAYAGEKTTGGPGTIRLEQADVPHGETFVVGDKTARNLGMFLSPKGTRGAIPVQ